MKTSIWHPNTEFPHSPDVTIVSDDGIIFKLNRCYRNWEDWPDFSDELDNWCLFNDLFRQAEMALNYEVLLRDIMKSCLTENITADVLAEIVLKCGNALK